jgi:nucleoside-diphosphate-sugar epimerase
MKNVLVTGGTGLIGSFLLEKLVKFKSYKIKCMALKNSDTKFLKDLGIKVVYGNLTDINSLKKAVKGSDIVFHLAAAFKKDLPKNADRKVYNKINVYGTENLMKVCREEGISRFIHFSASGVYGHSSDKLINEESPYRPTNPYEVSKCEGEKVAVMYNKMGLPVTIIQPTIVYGPRETVAFMRLFKAIQDGTFRIIGDGKNCLHLVYVENLVDGVILASRKKSAIGQKYLIGDDKAYSVRKIVDTIASELGTKVPKMNIPYRAAWFGAIPFELLGRAMKKRPMISRYTVNFLAKNRVYDISKAKKELGYSSKVSLKEGIKITADWYRSKGFLR